MKLVLSITWYPWNATVSGPARTDEYRNLYLDLDVDFERLPAVGESFYFEDGGVAQVESVTWKLDGTPYLFLGRRQERKGEPLDLWTKRGFEERGPQVTQQLGEQAK